METKKCTKCGEVKPVSEFGLKGEWRRNQCKSCKAIQRANWLLLNPSKVAEYSSRWRSLNAKRHEEMQLNARTNLLDSYVAHELGFKVAECPTELIALKREQLQMFRLNKQLKQQLKGI